MYKGFMRLVNNMMQVKGEHTLLLAGYYVVLKDEFMNEYVEATAGSFDEDEQAEREWREELHIYSIPQSSWCISLLLYASGCCRSSRHMRVLYDFSFSSTATYL